MPEAAEPLLGIGPLVKWERPDQIAAMWERYYREARRIGKHWEGCHACPPEERDPNVKVDVHHVVDQQRLKELAGREKWPTLRLLRLLTDPRNSMLLCARCHHLQTVRLRKLPLRAIRPPAWDYIREHDFTDWVRANYTATTGREGVRDGDHRRRLDAQQGHPGP